MNVGTSANISTFYHFPNLSNPAGVHERLDKIFLTFKVNVS